MRWRGWSLVNAFVCVGACMHACLCVAHTLRALCVLIMLSILGMHCLEVTGLGPWLNEDTHKDARYCKILQTDLEIQFTTSSQRFNCLYFLYPVWLHLYNRWLWLTPTYSQAVQLSNTRACGSPGRHLSTPMEWLNSYCATFSLAIVWAAGRETHKSLPSLSHRKSVQATP